ncbi:MAG: DUF1840 domain-containing protein [Pseudomonadota bacterium]
MLITFRSKASSDVMMFGDIAINLLKFMGHSATVPGAIAAKDVPTALQQLKSAVAAGKAAPTPENSTDDEENESSGDSVSLANRALPLIQLLTAAASAKCDVMWDK